MGRSNYGRVNGAALGKAMGLLWAGGVVVFGLRTRQGLGEEWRYLLAEVYQGYDSTDKGIVTGAVWALADAVIGAYLLAWLYNLYRQSEN